MRNQRPASFELEYSQAQAAHVALLEYLRENDVTICGETAIGSYAETSQLDSTVRLAIRLNRYLLGGKHYNHSIVYDRSVASIWDNS